MKPLPFFVFLSFICIIFTLLCPILKTKAKQVRPVTVSVTIDEYLTYIKNGQNLTVETNSTMGFIYIGKNEARQFFGPSEKSFLISKEQTAIIVNF